MPNVSECLADCMYQEDSKCTCKTDITLNEDFECEMYEEASTEE
jgi:hypothetical protein